MGIFHALSHSELHKTNVTNVAIKRYRNLPVDMVIQQASRKSLPHKQNFLPFLSKDLLDITSSYKDTWQHVCSNCYACCPFYLFMMKLYLFSRLLCINVTPSFEKISKECWQSSLYFHLLLFKMLFLIFLAIQLAYYMDTLFKTKSSASRQCCRCHDTDAKDEKKNGIIQIYL